MEFCNPASRQIGITTRISSLLAGGVLKFTTTSYDEYFNIKILAINCF